MALCWPTNAPHNSAIEHSKHRVARLNKRPDGKNVPADRARSSPAKTSQASDIAAFVAQAKSMTPAPGGTGRLVFALDATMSRQPTWDTACRVQGQMFDAVGQAGGLNVQLVYFRGFGECRASRWVADTKALAGLMTKIDCRGGETQIGKVLKHARNETSKKPVSALVFIGDAVEENIDALCAIAGELGLLKVPCFMFHEGRDAQAGAGFKEIARLSGGAYFHFGDGAAAQLAELLKAVAVYATGGVRALTSAKGRAPKALLEQLGPSGR